MAKVYAEVNGELVEPKLLLDPPGLPFVNEPTIEEIKQLLEGYSAAQWEEGDASIHYPEGDMGVFFAPDHGYFLVVGWKDGREDYLRNRLTMKTDKYVDLEAGSQYRILENYFVPFGVLWQGIEYVLKNKKLDPSLMWTEEAPFPVED